MQTPRTTFALGLFFALVCAPLFAQDFGETVEKHGSYGRDLYAAGREVRIEAHVTGDVVVAGGLITVGDEISGDVLAAGGKVDLRARVHDDVRAAGGDVTLGGDVGDDAVIAGGHLVIERGATVHGRALLAGAQIDFDGKVEKSLHAAGGDIRVGGDVLGDAKLYGENIRIASNAIIHGNLIYRSPNVADISDSARILGTITHEALDLPNPRTYEARGRVFFAVCLFTTALVLFQLFPHFSIASARYIREAPMRSFGLGFTMLAAVPLAVILLVATIAGAWLGLVLLAGYLLLLSGGYIAGLLFIADFAIQELRGTRDVHRGWISAALAIVVLAVTLLSWMPFAAALATFVILLLGIGAITATSWRRYAAH